MTDEPREPKQPSRITEDTHPVRLAEVRPILEQRLVEEMLYDLAGKEFPPGSQGIVVVFQPGGRAILYDSGNLDRTGASRMLGELLADVMQKMR